MESFTVAVFTDNKTTVDKLLEPYWIQKKVEKIVYKTKIDLIMNESINIRHHIRDFRNALEITTNKEKIKEIKSNICYLDTLSDSSSEEIYENLIHKYNKELLNENGDLLKWGNPYGTWEYYNKNSQYTKFIVIENPNKKGDYIYVNNAKVSEIKWDLLDYKAIFVDAFLFPDGTWYDERRKTTTKIKKKDNQEIEYEISDNEKKYIESDNNWQVTIVECFI